MISSKLLIFARKAHSGRSELNCSTCFQSTAHICNTECATELRGDISWPYVVWTA